MAMSQVKRTLASIVAMVCRFLAANIWSGKRLRCNKYGCKHGSDFFKPVAIEVIIYFPTNTRADLDNRLTSILDMLVECIVLRDDKWQDVPQIAVQGEYRKGNGGAFVRITELEPHVVK